MVGNGPVLAEVVWA